jgi:hypothetical protein
MVWQNRRRDGYGWVCSGAFWRGKASLGMFGFDVARYGKTVLVTGMVRFGSEWFVSAWRGMVRRVELWYG